MLLGLSCFLYHKLQKIKNKMKINRSVMIVVNFILITEWLLNAAQPWKDGIGAIKPFHSLQTHESSVSIVPSHCYFFTKFASSLNGTKLLALLAHLLHYYSLLVVVGLLSLVATAVVGFVLVSVPRTGTEYCARRSHMPVRFDTALPARSKPRPLLT